MSYLVTGSSGHLGDALIRSLKARGETARGLDIEAAPQTTHVGSVSDREVVRSAMQGIRVVLHTATLHKPHVATHSKQAFIDTNITGTLVMLEEAVRAGVEAFVFTSTTSTFGDSLKPPDGEPAVWIDASTPCRPKNIYGATKVAAEDLCQLFHRNHGLPCIVLRVSRFFPESDDNKARRQAFEDANLKLNEFLYRRADIEDMVRAHLAAVPSASRLGFGRYVVSATTPFTAEDCARLRTDPAGVLAERVPEFEDAYARLGWRMLDEIDRVYDNAAARRDLGWHPQHDFTSVLRRVLEGGYVLSELAAAVGSKGYHPQTFADGPYPVE